MDCTDTSASHVELPAEVGIPEAETLRLEFLSLLNCGKKIHVCGSQVQRIGIAGMQVLAALACSLRSVAKPLTVLEPSDALVDAARSLGLEELFGFK